MTNTDKEIFLIQANLLKQASLLLGDRASQIELIERLREGISDGDREKHIAISLFKTRSLKLCKHTIDYLSDEIMRDDPKIYYFLMPHVRTLLDIYARFIHLLSSCKDDKQQALTCISYQLLSYRILEQEPLYKDTLGLYKNFLSQANFIFPENSSDYDYEWMKKKNLIFLKNKKLLTIDNIKKYSIYSIDIFKPKETYKIYSSFSEFLHGNPYYHGGTPHNERFWVVGMCLSILPFFIEIIDIYTLNKTNPRDFRIWLSEIKKSRPDFSILWRDKSVLLKNLK